ncbi:MAG: serine/threonine-protein kinase, partial [Pirellulaceae bacterium]|nr:serine/threonine-protein kinase [Pirellulaceae bacterium]
MPERRKEQPPTAAASSIPRVQGKLPWAEALQLVGHAALCVRDLHESERLHGAISIQAIRVDPSTRAITLLPPGKSCSFGGPFSAPDHCPLPLRRRDVMDLPTDANAARQRMADAGISFDPTWIDVYQLGTLLCRLGTGEPVSAYLSSPRTKAGVPHAIQTLIDRALGYPEDARFTEASQFLSALQQTLRDARGEGVPVGPAEGVGDGLPFASLGHFQIVARTGQGGMGDVYKGYDPALQRTVAIKVLPPELARQEDFVRRFRAEATAVARLTHPNVVQIYFVGEDQGHHFFAMQYVEGESLSEMLVRRGRLTPDQALPIVGQALAGLAAAHKQGIVHRDIKPANILLDRVNRRALLADFGLVKSVVAGTKMTATGIVLGTVDYLSPEQGRGQTVDARSDLYAIGVLLYHMLSGSLPFEADSPTAMIFQHVYEQPKPLHHVAPQVPEALCAIVHRLLAKSPADRHQTAEEVLSDIRA